MGRCSWRRGWPRRRGERVRNGCDWIELLEKRRSFGYVCVVATEPENLTVRILQELRDEVQQVRRAQDETSERLTDLTQRIDGNTLVFNLVAGVVHDHEQRIEKLESR